MWMKKRENAAVPKASVFFKLLSVILCLACIFTACGGKKTDHANGSHPSEDDLPELCNLNAPYSVADSLNPFFCSTQMNSSLMTLLYQGLFSLNSDMTVAPCLALSYHEGDRFVRITLPTGGMFADGTAITSADVVYSYNKAKSSLAYSGALSGITEAVADSPLEVTFKFANSVPNGVCLLTFPIVKNNTAEQAEDMPIGSGKYKVWKTDSGVRLERASADKDLGQIGSFTLVGVADSAKLMYALQTGEIDFFCSDLYGERISRSNAAMYTVPTNNLLFLGIRSSSYCLSFENVRRAISYAVNRDEIAESVYSGNAVASSVPIRPGTKPYASVAEQIKVSAVDYAAAGQCLKEDGFVNLGTDGVRSGDKGSLRFTLLVNSESGYREETAVCISQSLAKVGIGVTIKSVDYESYIEALQEGNYDLYLGEVKLPNNNDLSAFFGGSVSYGIRDNAKSNLSYAELLQGAITLPAFIGDYESDVPFVSLCFRNDVLVCSDKIKISENTFPFADCFGNTRHWNCKSIKPAVSESSTFHNGIENT